MEEGDDWPQESSEPENDGDVMVGQKRHMSPKAEWKELGVSKLLTTQNEEQRSPNNGRIAALLSQIIRKTFGFSLKL